MKALLNKKSILFFIALMLGISILNAQLPNQLSDRFNKKTLLSNLPHNPKGNPLRKHDPICKNPPFCLKAQTTLGGSNYDPGLKITPTSDGGFIVCGLANSNDGDFHVPASNGADAFVARYNKYSQLLWAKTFGELVTML